MKNKIKLGLALFTLGFAGILSILTVELPLDSFPPEVLEEIPAEVLKYLILVNPTILLVISIVVGIALSEKVKLGSPTLASALKIKKSKIKFLDQIKSALPLGFLAGILILLNAFIFNSIIPSEFEQLSSQIKLTYLARFLYGGFTEELLLRFGFMTLVTWVIYKATKKLDNKTYWSAIIAASLLFAVGHLPVAFASIQNPSITLLSYILIGNSLAGIIFGWLYWKKGLEAAFIAHIATHITMIIGEKLI